MFHIFGILDNMIFKSKSMFCETKFMFYESKFTFGLVKFMFYELKFIFVCCFKTYLKLGAEACLALETQQ